MDSDIEKYHDGLSAEDRVICEALAATISQQLPEAESKVWHGHPVWFLEGNPVVGYHRLKPGLRVLFWSGQSFPTPGLTPNGSFKAADFQPKSIQELATLPLVSWLEECRTVQWDYNNIMKNKGLVRLTSF
jgi:hypothetical protein